MIDNALFMGEGMTTPVEEWQRIIREGRQVIIGPTSVGDRTVSPVAILEGRNGRTLVHVHIDDENFNGRSRMRSYSWYAIKVKEEREPDTVATEARDWPFPPGSWPCPGQRVVFRRPL